MEITHLYNLLIGLPNLLLCIPDMGTLTRAQFDERKRELMWENLSTLTNRGFEFDVPLRGSLENEGIDGLVGLMSGKGIKKAKLSVGSADGSEWNNLRILLLDDQENFLSIIHAKSARVKTEHNLSVVRLELSGIDVQMLDSMDGNDSVQDRFVSFEKWKKALELSLNSEISAVSSLKNYRFTSGDFGEIQILNFQSQHGHTSTKAWFLDALRFSFQCC